MVGASMRWHRTDTFHWTMIGVCVVSLVGCLLGVAGVFDSKAEARVATSYTVEFVRVPATPVRDLYVAKVPGGWLVMSSVGNNITFVPEASDQWWPAYIAWEKREKP